jgi:hypothetical protein
MSYNKWFSPSSQIPVGKDQNSRFAERLEHVWFKKATGGIVRLGYLLTKLVECTNDLNDRVRALENVNKNEDVRTSSMGRTATGFSSLQTDIDGIKRMLPRYDREQHMRTIVPQTATAVAAQMVTDFQNSNSLISTVWVDGLKITIERR